MSNASTGATLTSGAKHGPGQGEIAYTYGRFQRGVAYATIPIFVLVAGAALWSVFNEGDANAGLPFLIVIIAINAFQTVPNLLSTVRLSGDALRIEKPLHDDQEVPYDDVGRVFLGGAAVEVYLSPDAPDYAPGRSGADATISRNIEEDDDLIRRLARRLPAEAAVENPSGEFAELRRSGG